MLQGVRYDGRRKAILPERSDRQADSVHCDRAPGDEPSPVGRVESDHEPPVVAVPIELDDLAYRVDVPLDEVSSQPRVGAERALEVYAVPRPEGAQRRAGQGLAREVGDESWAGHLDGGDTDSVGRDARARAQVFEAQGRQDLDLTKSGPLPNGLHPADALNQSREHMR
jgi:hypothetical protein